MSREEFEKRLQDYNNRSKAGSSTSNPQLPQEYDPRVQEEIGKCLREELVRTREKYGGLNLVIAKEPAKYDFLDTEWIGKPGILLERYTDENIAAIGRAVIPMLSSGISKKGAAAIFILAYHLKAPGSRFGEYIFNLDGSLRVMTDKPYSEYPDHVTPAKNNREVLRATGDPTREAALYSYIAASLFRLFTKPASNYVKAWSHILNAFSKYYAEPMRVRLPVPTMAALEDLKIWLSAEREKVTLYRFLYMSNSDESHKDLKNFLYDNHLLYTGMHIVSIILQLCDVVSCSPGSIVNAVKDAETARQMTCLAHIMKLRTQTDDNHQKKMWRYGRIFDEAFMRDLQTKSCPKLVYLLAEALRSEEPEKHNGILQITQLANVSEDYKRKCVITAQILLTILKNQPVGASSSIDPSLYVDNQRYAYF